MSTLLSGFFVLYLSVGVGIYSAYRDCVPFAYQQIIAQIKAEMPDASITLIEWVIFLLSSLLWPTLLWAWFFSGKD